MPTDTLSARSGSIPVITKLAFYDELLKISSTPASKERSRKFKRWVKGTAAVAAGTGVGTGIYMLGHEAARRGLSKHWNKIPPRAQTAILGTGASLGALGSAVLARKLMEEKREYEK